MKIYLTAAFVLLFMVGYGQGYYTAKTAPAKSLKCYESARDHAYKGDYARAIKEAEKSLKKTPNFIDAMYLIADLEVVGKNYASAEEKFRKIISLAPDYKPKVFYTYGAMLRDVKRYDEAADMLDRYLSYPIRSESLKKKVMKLKADMEFAATATATPVPFNPENLGEQINSKHPDYWPSVSVDGNSFILTRNVLRNEDFFVSRKKDGEWQQAKNIGPPINTPMNEGAQTISADGRFFAFTVCNREGDYGKCDIYFSELKKGNWTTPRNIGSPINTGRWESQPSLSADGNTLYFVRATDHLSGDSDIYVSKRLDEDTWSNPEKLPSIINTEYVEEAPFVHPDGRSLYFISTGHPGMGGRDLYMATLMENGEWDLPINLGYPINTEGDEQGLVVDLAGELAYMTSDRPGGYGGLDIYSFELPQEVKPQPVTYVKGKVFDAGTKTPISGTVELNNLDYPSDKSRVLSDEKGEFLICLPAGENYAFSISKSGYLFHSENFKLDWDNTYLNPFELEIGLVKIPEPDKPASPATVSKPVILKNVFFETGSAELQDASILELSKLRDLLQENSSLRIRIHGHTDNVGSETDNQILSDKRAGAVKQFLIDNGIAPSRLESKGFGESQPIDSNESEEGRANNRRTEFIILN